MKIFRQYTATITFFSLWCTKKNLCLLQTQGRLSLILFSSQQWEDTDRPFILDSRQNKPIVQPVGQAHLRCPFIKTESLYSTTKATRLPQPDINSISYKEPHLSCTSRLLQCEESFQGSKKAETENARLNCANCKQLSFHASACFVCGLQHRHSWSKLKLWISTIL